MKLLTTLSLSLALLFSSSGIVAENLNYNVISLHNSSSETVKRDTMNVNLSIKETGKDRNKISNIVTERTNRVLKLIRDNKSIKGELSNRNVYPSYIDGNPKKGEIWHDRASISVSSKNFEALSKFLASVQKDAAISGMYFSVSKEERREANERILTRAIHEFRQKAQTVANAMGKSQYKIVQMDINESGNVGYATRPRMMMTKSVASNEDAAIEMDTESGEEEVQINISGSIQVQ